MPIECEPLSFLEKSHCVPILLALDRIGMMNRNQIYKELNESIKVVIKRIEFLIDCDLIFEKTMKVKPFAKYIGLTGKGKNVAVKLWEIKREMEKPGAGFIGHLFVPLAPEEIEDTFGTGSLDEPAVAKDLKKALRELVICPECGSQERYLIETKGKKIWMCFRCGVKTESNPSEVANLYAIEYNFQ